MKKNVLTLVFLLIALSASSQVSWNVKGGVNLSSWLGDDGTYAKPGFRIGGGMEYAFNKTWAVQPSLLFSSKGVKGDMSFGGLEMKGTVNQLYLEMPVMAAGRFKVGRNTNLVIGLGPYVAYGVGGKTKGDISIDLRIIKPEVSVELDTFGNIDEFEISYKGHSYDVDLRKLGVEDTYLVKRFDAGVGLGTALEFGSIVLGLEAQVGLMEIVSTDDSPRNISISLNLGYKF